LIISAGFDSAKGDPLGMQEVQHETYHWLSQNCQRICPKILMVLEGGYSMETLVSCATNSVKALMGYKMDFLYEDIQVDELVTEAVEAIKLTAKAHEKYWKTAKELCSKLNIDG
jgi:histone deacetylase 6